MAVYFIANEKRDAVKIGKADDPSERLSQLQTANPEALVPLKSIPGGVAEERELHNQFKSDWIRGEWYRLTDTLKKFIQDTVDLGQSNATDDEEGLHRITVALESDAYEALKKFSLAERRSMASAVILAVESYLKRNVPAGFSAQEWNQVLDKIKAPSFLNLDHQEDKMKWLIFSGSMLVGTVEADSEDLAVAEARRVYGEIEGLSVKTVLPIRG